jgi:hypothetical protein
MSNGHPVHFANFICHVGDAELADVLSEIIIPAFETDKTRAFRDIRYLLHQVEVTNLAMPQGADVPVIIGRLIKDMVVRSEQQFDASSGQLLKAKQQMHTSPSSVFVLLLDSHKLIYCHETPNAPGLDAFKSTIGSFLSKAREDVVRQIHDDERATGDSGDAIHAEILYKCSPHAMSQSDITEGLKKPTLKLLRELIPEPNLEVVPLSNDETLREFIKRFKVLDHATVRLLRRNSEIDNDEFFEQVRNKGDDAGADVSTITYKNKSGLTKDHVVSQLESALTGNAEVQLSGKDETDVRIRGTNEEFKAVAKLTDVPSSIAIAARALLGVFNEYVRKGLVKISKPQHSDGHVALIRAVVAGHAGGQADGDTNA